MTEVKSLKAIKESSSEIAAETVSASNVLSLKEAKSIKANIDAAVTSDDGALVVVGWIFDAARSMRGMAAIKKSGGLLNKGYNALHFSAGVDGVEWQRIARPDVSTAVEAEEAGHDHGLCWWCPTSLPATNWRCALRASVTYCCLLPLLIIRWKRKKPCIVV